MSQNFIVLAAMFGFMYFLLIRPQKKQMESRKKNDGRAYCRR